MNRPVILKEVTYIVEDHSLVRSLMAAWFASRGHRVRGCDAIDLGELDNAGSGDLVVVDLYLGERDGVEVLRYLADRGYAGRVLLVSGGPDPVIEAARDVGAEFGLNVIGTLRKPVNFDSLGEIVDRAPRAAAIVSLAPAPDDVSLAEALANGAVDFHYQPILNARTFEVHGIELLARLGRPGSGAMSVVAALCGASERDLHALAYLAAARAEALARALTDRGLLLAVSINVPSNLVQRHHFSDFLKVLRRVTDAGPPVTLEISELDPFTDVVDARGTATSAVLHGIRLSLDDFGTLNSNIDRLMQIPFAELKVDRRFVDGCAHGGFRDLVCRSAIEIGRARGATIVAEGIERAEDFAHLRRLGVDYLQGYFIAQPLAFEALFDWLSAHRPENYSRFATTDAVTFAEDERS